MKPYFTQILCFKNFSSSHNIRHATALSIMHSCRNFDKMHTPTQPAATRRHGPWAPCGPAYHEPRPLSVDATLFFSIAGERSLFLNFISMDSPFIFIHYIFCWPWSSWESHIFLWVAVIHCFLPKDNPLYEFTIIYLFILIVMTHLGVCLFVGFWVRGCDEAAVRTASWCVHVRTCWGEPSRRISGLRGTQISVK